MTARFGRPAEPVRQAVLDVGDRRFDHRRKRPRSGDRVPEADGLGSGRGPRREEEERDERGDADDADGVAPDSEEASITRADRGGDPSSVPAEDVDACVGRTGPEEFVIDEQRGRADPDEEVDEGVLLGGEGERDEGGRGVDVPDATGVDRPDEHPERDERECGDEERAPEESRVVQQDGVERQQGGERDEFLVAEVLAERQRRQG